MTFGENVKNARISAGLTQLQLGERANLSKQIISNFERGYVVRPKNEQLERLATALNTSISDLLDENINEDSFGRIMFKDKQAYDSLSANEKRKIINHLQEQADFMIAKAKNNK